MKAEINRMEYTIPMNDEEISKILHKDDEEGLALYELLLEEKGVESVEYGPTDYITFTLYFKHCDCLNNTIDKVETIVEQYLKGN